MTGTAFFVTVTVITLLILSLVVLTVTISIDLALKISASLYARARRWSAERRERRALLRQARAVRYSELTSDDFNNWCEVQDDEV